MYRYDFTPIGETEPAIHKDVTYELEQYPEDKTEKALEKHCAPAIRGHMKDMLNAIATGCRYRARSYLHRELHSGQSVDEAGAHARLGRKGGARDRRRRGQPPAAAPLSQSVGPSSAGERVTGRSMLGLLLCAGVLFLALAQLPHYICRK